jgi:protein TonB
MNNFFLPSLLISLILHAGILVIPETAKMNSKEVIDIKDNKSIEVTLVRILPDIEIKEKEIKTKVPSVGKKDLDEKDLSVKTLSSDIEEKKVVKDNFENVKKSIEYKKEVIQENVSSIGKISIPVLKDKFILKQIDTLLVKNPPEYPELARMKGWQGKVVILAVTDDKGYVKNVQIYESSGVSILDTEAVKAVRKWKFSGINNKIQVKIPIEFVLYD